MNELSNWSRTTWIVVGALLVIAVLGWGFALDRDRRLEEHASQIAVLEGEQSALGQRFAELETTLADERQAAGDLAALNEQMATAQAELETVEAAKTEAEAAVEAAQGTVAEVVKNAGLATMVVNGGDTARAARLLHGADGVAQVAPFGATLHVVGTDPVRLKTTVEKIAKETGNRVAPSETSLEDVFIQLMGDAQDNMQ